jgi:recombination protein RecA
MSPEMKSNLASVCSLIDKKYGPGSIMHLTDEVMMQPDQVISTGSIQLDCALGIGGYRKGRIIEIVGQESSGKTTLAIHACANIQRQGRAAAFLDLEHSFDGNYAKSLGVDLTSLLLAQPDYAEQALDMTDMLVRSGDVGLIVIDSVAALIPQAELEGEMTDQSIGLQARIMSKAMRKMVGPASNSDCTILFINQWRQKIGVTWGSPNVTSGGNALKYYASQRLEIIRIGDVKKGEDVIGNRTKVKVIKNKVAPPKKDAEFDILYGRGVDSNGELVELAVADGIVEKTGAWYKYKGENIAQGYSNATSWISENPDIKEAIRKEILENRGLPS